MSIGTYTPDTVVSGNVPSQVPNENGDPGSVNAPAVAEPSSAFTGGKPVLLIAASGADAAYAEMESPSANKDICWIAWVFSSLTSLPIWNVSTG